MDTITKQTKRTKSLPFSVYFLTMALLALAGLADSVYLAVSHYRVYTDISYSSFCAISKAINCDTVSQSIHSIFLGVPVPVWGIIGYTFILLLLSFAWKKESQRQRIWPLIFCLSMIYSVCSVFLAIISVFYIHSYCLMCVLSFGINFALMYTSWIIRKRFDKRTLIEGLKRDIDFLWGFKKETLSFLFPALIFCLILVILFPSYWNLSAAPLSKDIPNGITKEGYPWIGARYPVLEIMEFVDYQCFQCKKMHFFLRQLIAKYPDKIRLIHRHFPMDHKYNPIVGERYHVGSGTMALLAEYAKTEDKFWQMNDVLFNMAGKAEYINIKEIAEKTGLDFRKLARYTTSSLARYKVKHDIAVGIKLGITGTPGYLIGGKVYLGQIPPGIISSVLN